MIMSYPATTAQQNLTNELQVNITKLTTILAPSFEVSNTGVSQEN